MTANSLKPLLLLTLLGFNGAVYLVLGKFVTDAGGNGLLLALGQAAGAAAVLGPLTARRGERLGRSRTVVGFYAGGAVIGILLPAVATFWVLPHIGAGLMAVSIATSPIMTALIAQLVGIEKLNLQKGLGIAGAFAGAALIVGGAPDPSVVREPLWLAAGLLVPFLLACGNVYRTLFWPEGHSAPQVGAGIGILGIVVIAPMAMLTGGPAAALGFGIGAAAALIGFVALNGFNALPYYYLQQIAGPVYLSLLSHMMAAFGILLGILVFGERFSLRDIGGVALVLTGVALVTLSRARQARRAAAAGS